jgi:glyoxylase I family protein
MKSNMSMRFEHLAINVKDARAVAKWYVDTLGLVVKRQGAEPPYMTFVGDSGGNMMFEFYEQPAAGLPDYASMVPNTLHVAFLVDDMDSTRAKWLAAGGKAEGDVTTTPAGDKLAFVRDPWGLTLQLVQRKTPMLPMN